MDSMDELNSEDAKWKDILDAQLHEQRQNRRLFKRVRPFFIALCVIIPTFFFLQARSEGILREQVMSYTHLGKLIGVPRAKFKKWALQHKYPIRRETATQVTIAIWNRDVGLHKDWIDDAVEISANFDSRSRLVSFGPFTKIRIIWF